MSVTHYSTEELGAILAAACPYSASDGDRRYFAAVLASMSRTNAAAWNRTYAEPGCFFDTVGRIAPSRVGKSKARAILRAAQRRPMMAGTPAFTSAVRDARLLAYNCASNGGTVQASDRQLGRWSHVLASLLSRTLEVLDRETVRA